MKRAIPASLLLLFASCGNPDDAFIGSRVELQCGGAIPVCEYTAACELDNGNYVQASLPGEQRFLVRTDGPAELRVSIFLVTPKAAGTQTEIEWWEAGCGARYVETVDGTSFFKEAGDRQEFTRARTVTTAGDHYVRIQSDATADALFKVEITPQ